MIVSLQCQPNRTLLLLMMMMALVCLGGLLVFKPNKKALLLLAAAAVAACDDHRHDDDPLFPSMPLLFESRAPLSSRLLHIQMIQSGICCCLAGKEGEEGGMNGWKACAGGGGRLRTRPWPSSAWGKKKKKRKTCLQDLI